MSERKVTKHIIEASEAGVFVKLSKLKKRNIALGSKKTSVTLEPLVWELFHDIAQEQECHVNDLCSFIDDRKNSDASLSSAIRVFVMAYMNIQLKGREV